MPPAFYPEVCMIKRGFLALLVLALLVPAAGLAGELTVTFYDVGKADAMLITSPQGVRILIDAGTNKNGKALAKRFEAEGIDHIDMMIITHFDKDHVGGADKILESVSVGRVIMPVYAKESKQYEQFTEALSEHGGTEIVKLSTREETSFSLEDGVTLRVTAAHENNYGSDEENDFSLCVRMHYGDTRFLFPGDAEDARQREILAEGDADCDVLKVPYHGRLVNASQDFMTAASPKIAFIPDSDEDSANGLLVAMLHALGTDIHSARDGDLTVVSDGTDVRIAK